MQSGLKRLLYFVATHEVVFKVLALFGCLNFARNVVFHRLYSKGAFQRIVGEPDFLKENWRAYGKVCNC